MTGRWRGEKNIGLREIFLKREVEAEVFKTCTKESIIEVIFFLGFFCLNSFDSQAFNSAGTHKAQDLLDLDGIEIFPGFP